MTKQKIAIIGGGIIGSTVAYYLAHNENWHKLDVTLFDDGIGQATSAAAGIISPWLSKRRNQKWYRLACLGANVVKEIAMDTKMDGAVYQQTGTIITRNSLAEIKQLQQLAKLRRLSAPLIGQIKMMTAAEVNLALPMISNQLPGLWVGGGARMDGRAYSQHLLKWAQKRNLASKKQKVTLTKEKIKKYNKIIICAGAWINPTLSPLGIHCKIRPQKGQLIQLKLHSNIHQNNLPVLMPEGEYDFIPITSNKVIIGATHENDQGFNLQPDLKMINRLLVSAQSLIPNITIDNVEKIRVGTRAYTDDFAPFLGYLPNFDNILIGGGLGSSGLTTGPMIAKLLAEEVLSCNHNDWSDYTKPITNYLS